MNFSRILSPLCALLLALAGCHAAAQETPFQAAPAATAAITPEAALLEMKNAARRKDAARIHALLPLVQGHALAVWGEYWALKARLDDAAPAEVQAFVHRWAGTYQEDRLRADWLLLAGKRGDWGEFAIHYPHFRMRDDANLRCWDIARLLDGGTAPAAADIAAALAGWNEQRKESQACQAAATQLHARRLIADAALWDKARAAVQDNRPRLATAAVAIASQAAASELAAALNKPEIWLARHAASDATGQHIASLALLRLAMREPQRAAALMAGGWQQRLPEALRPLTWALIGKWAAIRHSAQPDIAAAAFANVPASLPPGAALPDELLIWRARSAVRRSNWTELLAAVDAMQHPDAGDGAWVYWRARARLALRQDTDAAQQELRQLATRDAGDGFYPRLAQEELGLAAPLGAEPAQAQAMQQSSQWQAVQNHNGLRRALLAIMSGLPGEGVREWNYWTRLHTAGGMSDVQLYAAAHLACSHHVWDRCIAASERTRAFASATQRWPLPLYDDIQRAARGSGLSPALLYGLIHQESRFVPTAGSGAGARGLMQLMPATARTVARQLGLAGYSGAHITDVATNLALGSEYLRQQLARFDNSFPMAAAAYNAGPGRPREWRGYTAIEGAAWVESIPFNETRTYVKRVLHATQHYATRLGGPTPTLHALLGTITPPPPEPLETEVDTPQ